jgi:hypothetical protein
MSLRRRHFGRCLILAFALLAARLGGVMTPRAATATATGCSGIPNSYPVPDSPPLCVKGGTAICYECANSVGDGYYLCAERANPEDGFYCDPSPDIPTDWGPAGDDGGGDDGGGSDGGGDDGGGAGGDDGGGDDHGKADGIIHGSITPPGLS